MSIAENIAYGDNEGKIDYQKSAVKAQEEAYKQVINICRTTNKGHILLFSTGEGEIKQAVEYLNKMTPLGVVALPYFSKLHSNYKSVISNIP
jgi:HrpA-like RNA helicase